MAVVIITTTLLFAMQRPASLAAKDTEVFAPGELGYTYFWAPGAVVTQRSTVLVFAEARFGGDSDTPDPRLTQVCSIWLKVAAWFESFDVE